VESAELVVDALTARVTAGKSGRTSPEVVDSSAALKALACKALGERGETLVERPASHREELVAALNTPCAALVAAAREVLASTRRAGKKDHDGQTAA
jgi:hypothetical protein